MRSLETERRKLGDEKSSTTRGFELEIERMERDLVALEDDLLRAREEVERGEDRLRQKDLEVAAMVCSRSVTWSNKLTRSWTSREIWKIACHLSARVA